VRIRDLTGEGGTVSVTAYGGSKQYCKVESWFPDGDAQNVQVNCFDAAGNRADSREPNSLYRFSSTGMTVSVARINVGIYLVRLPGFRRGSGDVTGIAKVTAYGPGSTRCYIDFGPGGFAAIDSVIARCTTPAGELADSQFTVTYVQDGNLLGASGHDTAYVRVRSDGTLVDPPSEFAFPTDGSVQAERIGPGAYRVRLPVNLNVGHAQVTADLFIDPQAGRHCKISRWNPSEGVLVVCFAADGRPQDAGCQLTFVGPGR
jgi:hypothetical protein